MARFQNDPFPGTNYGQYKTWPVVTDPTTGAVIGYEVPGYPQYIYDEVASNASGRKVFRGNPKGQITKQQEAEAAQKKLQKQQENAASPLGQITPVVGTIGGAVAANELYKAGIGNPPAKVTTVLADGTTVFDDGSRILSNGVKVPAATPQQVPPANIQAAAGSVAPANAQVVPLAQSPNVNPGQMQSPMSASQSQSLSGETAQIPPDATVADDGTVISRNGEAIGRAVQGASGLYQIYSGYKEFQDGDKVKGGLTVGTGALNVGAAAGSTTAANYVPYANAALGAYNAYNAFGQEGLTSEQQVQSGAKAIGKSAADAFTFGLATPVIGAIENSSFGKKYGPMIDKFDAKYNPVTIGLSKFGSSKGGDQLIRDQYRKQVIESGGKLFNKDYQGTLADGSTFDFGADGSKLSMKNIDFKDPTVGKAAAYGNVLATIQGAGKEGDARRAIATQFIKGSTANANGDLNVVKANNAHFLKQIGVNDIATGQARLDEAKNAGKITDNEYQVFSNDLKELYAPAPTPGKPNKPAGVNVPVANVNAAASAVVPPPVAKPAKLPWMR